MNVQHLSSQYTVRDLLPADAEAIYEVLKANTLFYKYHPPMVTVEGIMEDMKALPPRKGYEDKHYIGFFRGDTLTALSAARNCVIRFLCDERQPAGARHRNNDHLRQSFLFGAAGL